MKHISLLYFTSAQEKVRNQWRIAVITILILFALIPIFFSPGCMPLWILSLALFIGFLLQFSIAWVCAYNKPGTKFLSYHLLLGILFLLQWTLPLWIGFRLLGAIATLPLFWYSIATWRLRKVNKDIQDANFVRLFKPNYIQHISKIGVLLGRKARDSINLR